MSHSLIFRRWGASAAAMLLLHSSLTIPVLGAQDTPATGGLRITILEGDNAIVNVRQRVGREAIVQVEDENRKPVAGALVTFLAPDSGASTAFSNGANSITLTADNSGRVTLRNLKPNQVAGQYQIRVVANAGGLRGSAVITRTNMLPVAAAAGGISMKVLAIILAGAAAGVVGGVVAANGGSSSPTVPTPTAAVVVTPGTPTVGPPR
jgi:hypothetical protein